MKALLVEDDSSVAEALTEALGRYGWDVHHVATGREALAGTGPGNIRAAGDGTGPDIVLLDLNLPDMDGIEVCRSLRSSSRVPIIAVTARSGELDKVLCLRVGADDYVVKPYRMQELLARMTAVLRRTGTQHTTPSEPVITEGALTIDRARRIVTLDGDVVELTRKEFDLLALLAASPTRVFPRERLLDAVWDQQWPGNSRSLDAHVAAIRRKLGSREWIRTSRGVGFSFEPPIPGPNRPHR
ncbi:MULTISPECIES: response regulator transcription factor [unclassified Streptomyces]|uniref:response regulator transcription factor n=1 Tax=unclassified Streptomyces TaxID=2593676 RepID=UPI0022B72992|nr:MULTISPECIES: response regulator transcription factor [unclassified Streptomyces]MCZ7414481.1 response regulator transcription factor [Streptomyces sp. WMMC897]MCZ7431437.1 response regulator transcription factor [Streptomyces sp. WMMC1477]